MCVCVALKIRQCGSAFSDMLPAVSIDKQVHMSVRGDCPDPRREKGAVDEKPSYDKCGHAHRRGAVSCHVTRQPHQR